MIRIISEDFTQNGFITNAKSFSISEKYNDFGTFTLIIGASDLHPLLKLGSWVLYDGIIGAVEKIEINTTEITVNGYTGTYVLNRRTALFSTHIENVETDLYKLVTDNLRMMNISVATPHGYEAVGDFEVRGKELGSAVNDVCHTVGLGCSVGFTGSGVEFRIYQGEDLTDPANPKGVYCSVERGNLASLVVTVDETNFSDCAVVEGKDEQGKIVRIVIGNDTAHARELYVDKRNEPQQQGEHINDYKVRLGLYGQEALSKTLLSETFNLEVAPSDRFELGDMVSCAYRKIGLEFKARVSVVTKTLDRNGERTIVTLGEPRNRRS